MAVRKAAELMRDSTPPQYWPAAQSGTLGALLDVLGPALDGLNRAIRSLVEGRWLAARATAGERPSSGRYATHHALDALAALVCTPRRNLRTAINELEDDSLYRLRIGVALQRRSRAGTPAMMRAALLEELGFDAQVIYDPDFGTVLERLCEITECPEQSEQVGKAIGSRHGPSCAAAINVARATVPSAAGFTTGTATVTVRTGTIVSLTLRQDASLRRDFTAPARTATESGKIAQTAEPVSVPNAPHQLVVSYETGFDIARFDEDPFDDPEVEVELVAERRKPATISVSVISAGALEDLADAIDSRKPTDSQKLTDGGKLVATRLLNHWVYKPRPISDEILDRTRCGGVEAERYERKLNVNQWDDQLKDAAARSQRLDVYLRRVLAVDPDPAVRSLVARRPRLWDITWHELARQELAAQRATEVLESLALRDDLPPPIASTLAEAEAVSVRQALAARQQLDDNTLRRLANDDAPSVRVEVARRRRLPDDVEELLTQDSDASVQQAMARRMVWQHPRDW